MNDEIQELKNRVRLLEATCARLVEALESYEPMEMSHRLVAERVERKRNEENDV